MAAIKRLKAGQGAELTLEEHLMELADIFPEYKHITLNYVEEIKDIEGQLSEMRGSPSMILLPRKIIRDKLYPGKLKLVKKHCHLMEKEYALYEELTGLLAVGGDIPKSGKRDGFNPKELNDHSLKKNGTKDLRDFRSFCLRYHENYKKRIICLYSIKGGKLRLANIGLHDLVYKYAASDGDTNIRQDLYSYRDTTL